MLSKLKQFRRDLDAMSDEDFWQVFGTMIKDKTTAKDDDANIIHDWDGIHFRLHGGEWVTLVQDKSGYKITSCDGARRISTIEN